MHKININLHNLKTALIFSMEISRDYSSRHGLRMCQILGLIHFTFENFNLFFKLYFITCSDSSIC